MYRRGTYYPNRPLDMAWNAPGPPTPEGMTGRTSLSYPNWF